MLPLSLGRGQPGGGRLRGSGDERVPEKQVRGIMNEAGEGESGRTFSRLSPGARTGVREGRVI